MMRVKKNECRGRGADSKWGVQKIKERKKEGGACGPMDFGFGPVWPTDLGSGQKRYKRVETHFFLISFFSFSLFSFFRAKRSLLSPPSPLSFPARQRAVEGSPTRWPASYRGGATASELKPPPFFSKFFFSYVFYPPDSVSELKIPEKLAYDPRSRD